MNNKSLGQNKPFSFFIAVCFQAGSFSNSDLVIDNNCIKSSGDKYISKCVGSTPSGKGRSNNFANGYVVFVSKANSVSTGTISSLVRRSYKR